MTFKSNQFTRASAAIAALVCLIAGTAQAGSPAAATRTVSYGDLNLASEQGASALYTRVAYAARQVCGGNGVDIRDLQAYASQRACESQAISRALNEVHAPKLAARFAAHR